MTTVAQPTQAGGTTDMRYTLRQIEYFIATAEAGSITVASELINISSPSISTAIAHLELELDTQLFVRRHGHGLTLTQAGAALLVEAKRLVDYAEQLYAVVSDVVREIRGTLSFGCMVTMAPMILPELSHSFTSTFPGTQVVQVVGDHDTLLQKLANAEIDVAVTYNLLVPDHVGFSPLASLPPHLLVAEQHRFATRAEVTLAEMALEPLLLLDLPISREYFLSLFLEAGIDPKIGGHSPHQEVLRTMVANGYGYTLANVRPRTAYALDGRRVVRISLAGEPRPMVIGLATLKDRRRSRLVETFVEHCRGQISDAGIPGMASLTSD